MKMLNVMMRRMVSSIIENVKCKDGELLTTSICCVVIVVMLCEETDPLLTCLSLTEVPC